MLNPFKTGVRLPREASPYLAVKLESRYTKKNKIHYYINIGDHCIVQMPLLCNLRRISHSEA